MKPSIYFVIGDIHGEAQRLKQLHRDIFVHRENHYGSLPATLIHLGDYVDRGQDSYAVIEHLMHLEKNPPENLSIINLKGNHEAMMLRAEANKKSIKYYQWLKNGGREALQSYKRRGYNSVIQRHLDWVSSLPVIHHDEDNKLIFVHAGLNNNTYPHDGEAYYLWTRSPDFFDCSRWNNPALAGITVIHGHTPTDDFKPEIRGNMQRLNLDTGACYGGPLTAAVIEDGKVMSFLTR